MEYRKFDQTYVVRIDRGEEVIAELTKLAEKEGIRLAKLEGLGAASRMVIGLYNVEEQKYMKTEINEPTEITSLVGSITEMDGRPYFHIHAAAGKEDGSMAGGHLNEAVIGGTCEIFVTVIDGTVGRRKDDHTGTGLNLFDFS
ncbi:MAG: PPC domain-containing DNA-binding protein [Bilifractor sp.]